MTEQIKLGRFADVLNKLVERAERKTPADFLAEDLDAKASQLPPTLSNSSLGLTFVAGSLAALGLGVLVIAGPVINHINEGKLPEGGGTYVSGPVSPVDLSSKEVPSVKITTTLDLPQPITEINVITDKGIWTRDQADRDTLSNRVLTGAPGDQQQFKALNAGDVVKERIDRLVLQTQGKRRVIFAVVRTDDGGDQFWALSDSDDREDHNGVYALVKIADGRFVSAPELIAQLVR